MVCRWPQSQEGDWARPHLCKLARHGPWPVWKRFVGDHVWRGRSKPVCRIVGSVTTVWLTKEDQSSLHCVIVSADVMSDHVEHREASRVFQWNSVLVSILSSSVTQYRSLRSHTSKVFSNRVQDRPFLRSFNSDNYPSLFICYARRQHKHRYEIQWKNCRFKNMLKGKESKHQKRIRHHVPTFYLFWQRTGQNFSFINSQSAISCFKRLISLTIVCRRRGAWLFTGGPGGAYREFVRFSDVLFGSIGLRWHWMSCHVTCRPLKEIPTTRLAVICSFDSFYFHLSTRPSSLFRTLVYSLLQYKIKVYKRRVAGPRKLL